MAFLTLHINMAATTFACHKNAITMNDLIFDRARMAIKMYSSNREDAWILIMKTDYLNERFINELNLSKCWCFVLTAR